MKIYSHPSAISVSAFFKKYFKRFHLIVYFLFFLFSFWLMFHTFSYDKETQTVRIAFKLWSDFGAHIPLIRSFSMGSNWPIIMRQGPIEYPIYPGEPIRYHFIFYMIVGLLERIGVRIDWALNIPSILGFFGLMSAIFLLAKHLFRSTSISVLAVVFFIFNGSLGFIRFFMKQPLSWKSPMDIYTAKDFPAFAPWGPGDVTAFWNLNIYTNQRHLAIAIAGVLISILMLLRIEQYPFKKQLPWAFILSGMFGLLPYFHQPAILIVAIVLACYFFVLPRLRLLLLFTGICSAALILPQILGVQGGPPTIEWHPGYIIHNDLVKMPTPQNILRLAQFWWQNMGLHAILIPIGFFLIPKRARLILLPIIPLFVIPNLFKFSMEASANHKFFNFVMILGNMISAYVIVRISTFFSHLYARKPLKKWGVPLVIRLTQWITIGAIIILLTLSGVIDFFVVKNDTIGTLPDIAANKAATWIAENTPPDAIFLNSSYLYHPASLVGRSIYLGWPYFAWSAGYVGNRFEMLKEMYEVKDPAIFCPFLHSNSISYITVENTKDDENLPDIDVTYYLNTFEPSYLSDDKTYAIFSTSSICDQ